jgi:hypothetical protein
MIKLTISLMLIAQCVSDRKIHNFAHDEQYYPQTVSIPIKTYRIYVKYVINRFSMVL